VFRLCVRNLRLFGRAEVDLMHQGEPQVRDCVCGGGGKIMLLILC
jgi:hypothetical protein